MSNSNNFGHLNVTEKSSNLMERAPATSKMVFKHLKEANLKIKVSKCQFFKNHLH